MKRARGGTGMAAGEAGCVHVFVVRLPLAAGFFSGFLLRFFLLHKPS